MTVEHQPLSDHPTGHVVNMHRVPDAPLAPPGEFGGIKNVMGSRYLLWLLFRREIAARYQGQVLGMVWSYVQPFSRFAIYFFVMGLVMGMHKNVPQFAVHMWAGFVFVDFFTGMLNAGTSSVVRNASLVQRMPMPREMFPISTVLVSIYQMIPPLMILLVVCLFCGWTPDAGGLAAGVVAFAILVFIGTGLSLVCSAANVYLRDFGSVVSIITTIVTFSVPMMYPFTQVKDNFSPAWVDVYMLNPLAEAVVLIQRCFWVHSTGDKADGILANGMPSHLMERGLWMLALSVVFLGVCQWAFSKLEPSFPERL